MALAGRHSEQGGEQGQDLVQRLVRWLEQRFELGQLRFRRIVAVQARRPPQLGDDWIKRAVGMLGRAVKAEWRVRLVTETLAQRPEQARFADTRLAREQDHLALTVLGPPPALEQYAELVLASD
jgi:hypothetical protein